MAVAAGAAGGSAASVSSAACEGINGTARCLVRRRACRLRGGVQEDSSNALNIKWVRYSGDNNGDGTLQSKFSLYNRVGWKAGVAPDVVFDEENYEAGWLGAPPFNDLTDRKPYISKAVWSKPPGLGRLHDQRQDSLPAQRQRRERALGQHEAVEPVLPRPVASDDVGGSTRRTARRWSRDHPGYYIGEFGQPWDAETYLWGNECPINEAVGKQVLLDNPSSPNCTTIAHLIDSARGAFTKDGPFTTAWVNDKTAQHMVMDIGAIWQGGAIYPSGSGSEGPGTNVMEAYPPPRGDERRARHWIDRWRPVDGARRTPSKPKAAAALVAVHGDEPEDPGEPKRHAGSSGLCARPGRVAEVAQRRLRQPVGDRVAAIKTAAGEIWTGWSPVPWSVESIFGNSVTPGLLGGGSFTSALSTLAGNIKSAAQSAGWQVKKLVEGSGLLSSRQ